jgi:predicted DNA-binding transcriptional regulator AlpA
MRVSRSMLATVVYKGGHTVANANLSRIRANKNQSRVRACTETLEPIPANSGPSRLLTPKQTAEFLGLTEGTLATWRCVQRYRLPYIKVGRRVMYRSLDIEKFIASRCVGDVA